MCAEEVSRLCAGAAAGNVGEVCGGRWRKPGTLGLSCEQVVATEVSEHSRSGRENIRGRFIWL